MELNDNHIKKLSDHLVRLTAMRWSGNASSFLRNHLSSYEGSLDELIDKLDAGDKQSEQDLINHLTIRETFFFRGTDQFEFLKKNYFSKQNKKLKIWSAACSSGSEPYSIAMMLHNCFPQLFNNSEIMGSDVSVDAIKKCKSGEYSTYDMNRIPDEYKSYLKYFDGNQLSETIRDKVKFFNFNLLDNFFLLAKQDVIFIRNVLIYFDMDIKISILKKVHNLLNDDGILVLATTEYLPEETRDLFDMSNLRIMKKVEK